MNEKNGIVFSLFTQFDSLKLARNVGSGNASQMIKDEIKETWEFEHI